MKHEEYLKRRDELIKIRNDSFDSLDKHMIGISTGGLVLIVINIDKIGRPIGLITTILLFFIIACLFLILLSTVLSFVFAKENADLKISNLNTEYQKYIDKKTKETQPENENIWYFATEFANKFSLIVFLLSILLFVVYIGTVQFHQLSNEQKKEVHNMTEKKQVLNEGKTPATPAIQKPTPNALPGLPKPLTKGMTDPKPAIPKPKK